MKPMTKMLIWVGVFFTLVFGWYGVKKGIFMWYMSHYKPPAATVSTTKATSKPWQDYVSAVGTLTAINGVDISPEISGIIEEIRFNSGQSVKKGDVLLVLRSQVERANLKNSEAKLELAKLNYDREKVLYSKKVSSKSLLDTRYAELRQAEASVESIKAQLQQKTIIAPFDGKLGIREVNVGQYISPGTTIVTLQSLNPLYVNFNLPEQNLANIAIGQAIDVVIDLDNGKTVHGTITAINSKVEQNTRNILLQATIDNANNEFYPGMYGLLKIYFGKQQNLIVVPQTAISYSLSGDYVYIIKNNISRRQYVKVGDRREDVATILEGIKAGDVVVTAGQLKLHDGATVAIDNSVKL